MNENDEIPEQNILDLPSLDNDPVTNSESFKLSDEIFELRRSRQFIEDFESLVDMAGD